MNLTKERLHEIEQNGYQLDFGNVFNHAFENYKKIALYAGLLLFIITFVLGFLLFLNFASFLTSTNLENINKQLIDNLEHQKSLEAPILSMAFAILVFLLLLAPFSAGFYKMAEYADKDEEFRFIDIFSFYKAPYFINIILATILISLINMFVSTSVISILNLINIANFGIIQLASQFISLLVFLFTFMTIPLIAFGKLKAVEAIKYSFKIVLKQPFLLLGLLVVSIIGSMVGLMACCIGVFFTLPFLYSMNYAIYNAIVGVDYETDTEENNSFL